MIITKFQFWQQKSTSGIFIFSFHQNFLAAYNTARFDVNSLHGGNQKKDKQLLPDDGKGQVKVSIFVSPNTYFILADLFFRSGVSRYPGLVFASLNSYFILADFNSRFGVSRNSRRWIYQKKSTACFTTAIVTLFCTRIKFEVMRNTSSITDRYVTSFKYYVISLLRC